MHQLFKCLLLSFGFTAVGLLADPTAEQVEFFEKNIRPVCPRRALLRVPQQQRQGQGRAWRWIGGAAWPRAATAGRCSSPASRAASRLLRVDPPRGEGSQDAQGRPEIVSGHRPRTSRGGLRWGLPTRESRSPAGRTLPKPSRGRPFASSESNGGVFSRFVLLRRRV